MKLIFWYISILIPGLGFHRCSRKIVFILLKIFFVRDWYAIIVIHILSFLPSTILSISKLMLRGIIFICSPYRLYNSCTYQCFLISDRVLLVLLQDRTDGVSFLRIFYWVWSVMSVKLSSTWFLILIINYIIGTN